MLQERLSRYFIKESVGNETVTSITGTLEGFKLAEKDPNSGRQLTSQGRRDLDRIAPQIKLAAAENAKRPAAAKAVI